MSNTTVEALDTFTTSVTSQVSATDVLTILGKGVAAGFAIYVVIWAAKKIVRTFKNAMNGRVGV